MNVKKYFFLILVMIGISCLFSSCKEQNEYKGIVIVSFIDTFNVKTPVAHCKLVFGEEDYAPDVKRTDYTDVSGRYEGIWKKDVSIPVVATKEIDDVVYTGASSLKVKLQGAEPVEIIFQQQKQH